VLTPVRSGRPGFVGSTLGALVGSLDGHFCPADAWVAMLARASVAVIRRGAAAELAEW